MTYQIIKELQIEDLIFRVNTSMKCGWQLAGGLVVYETPGGDPMFCQAMFKMEFPIYLSEVKSNANK